MTLADLTTGDKAKIDKIGGAAATSGRLLEMGMTRGAIIKIRRVAPLGDPIEIDVRGYNLSLRRNEAKGVEVTKLDSNNN